MKPESIKMLNQIKRDALVRNDIETVALVNGILLEEDYIKEILNYILEEGKDENRDQAEIQAVRAVGKIRQILEEVRDCGSGMDLTKTAVEIYELSREDAEIVDNMKAYWNESASGAEK